MVAYAVGYGVYALEKAFFTGTVGRRRFEVKPGSSPRLPKISIST